MLDIEHYFSIHNRSWDCLGEISAQEKQSRIDLAICYRLSAKMQWDDAYPVVDSDRPKR
jgi:hypothetical protein